MDAINLDHNATTPTRPEVVEAMVRCYAAGYANAASQHRLGQKARKVVEEARHRIAQALGTDIGGMKPDRLLFTSGGTESNNLALLGIAAAAGQPGQTPQQIIVSAVEHSCVLEAAEHLLERGWRLDTLPVDRNGVVCCDYLPRLLSEQTRLVSVTLANHETGALQPIEALAKMCNSAGVPLHTDAVAMAGKLPINFRARGVAALSVAAHKFQGPLGIGALIVRHDVALAPLMFGGHQQYGLRPGTEPVALAVGMQTAIELAQKEMAEHAKKLEALCERFVAGLKMGFPEIVVHAAEVPRLPNTVNIAFPGIEGQILLLALDTSGVACSVGSACASGSTELSPALRAMGLPNDIVASSLRFSLGATTSEAEIDEAVRRILRVCGQLR
jgi:cysteine desulfurase